MMAGGFTGERSGTSRALDLLFRALLVVAIFALVGPPVGGLIAWLAMGAWSLRSPLPFLTQSYPEALPIAAGTGLIVAAGAFVFGKTGWGVAVVAALVANLLFHSLLLVTSPPASIDAAGLLSLAEVFLPPSLVAALVCWLLTRRLLKRAAHEQ